MAFQIVNIGTAPNDGTGDTVRAAFNKVNTNFSRPALAPFSIPGVAPAANSLPYYSAPDAVSYAPLTAYGRTVIALADASALRVNLAIDQVENTSDADKPISTATQSALDLKADTADVAGDLGDLGDALDAVGNALGAHVGNTANPHSVTKAQVGLPYADNTSDEDKPVSAATRAALDGKVAKSGDTMAGPLAMDGNKITGGGDPTDPQDFSTKSYVDLVPRIERKATSNINLGNNPANSIVSFPTAGDMSTVGGLSWDGTNHRFTPPQGTWRMEAFVLVIPTTASPVIVSLARNGSEYKRLYQNNHVAGELSGAAVSVTFNANGADYFDIRVGAPSGGATSAYGSSSDAATRRIAFTRVARA